MELDPKTLEEISRAEKAISDFYQAMRIAGQSFIDGFVKALNETFRSVLDSDNFQKLLQKERRKERYLRRYRRRGERMRKHG